MTLAIANEDRIPHDRAVWREYPGLPYDGAPAPGTHGHRVAVDYDDGQIAEGWGHVILWRGVRRWRFGWSPAQ